MILVLGGTSESREVAILCAKRNYPVLYTSTMGIINDLPEAVERWTGILSPDSFRQLVDDKRVSCIVDATHPFAVEISRQAMHVCGGAGIPYLRLERPSTGDLERYAHVKTVLDVKRAAQAACRIPGAILSAVGVKNLPALVAELGDRRRDLIVRVLPIAESMEACAKLGIHPSRIIAMQGPFSKDFDSLLIKNFRITVMVSKESGDRGGLDAKIQACQETGCTLILIRRPVMKYPHMRETPEECMPWINEKMQERKE